MSGLDTPVDEEWVGHTWFPPDTPTLVLNGLLQSRMGLPQFSVPSEFSRGVLKTVCICYSLVKST